MASMSFNWSGRPSQRTASSPTSRRRSSSSLPSTGGMSGASGLGGGDPLVEGFGELLDGQQPALDLGRGAAPHVHGLLGPAADPGGWVAELVGGDQGADQGGVGALAIDEAWATDSARLAVLVQLSTDACTASHPTLIAKGGPSQRRS